MKPTRTALVVSIILFSQCSLAVALPFSHGPSRKSESKVQTKLDQQVDNYIRQQMAKYQIPGLSLAVVRDGKVLKLAGYGLASVEFDVPADANTVYQLFSVSKIFAGVAVMKLVEEGRLSLESPITDFIGPSATGSSLTNLPAEWKAIHVRHLLSHTSGLPEMSTNQRFACLPEDKKRAATAEDEVTYLAQQPLKFQPGEKWAYHLSGYHLLGYIVEKVTKKPYADFLREQIFEPLAMTSAQFGGTEAAIIRRRSSTSYSRDSGKLTGWIYPFSAKDYPAAGLNSSAGDLAKFLIALDTDRVLKQENREAMWSRVKLNDTTERGYGLGWTVGVHQGRKVVGHEGGGAIWVAHFPAEHLSVVILCNLNGARADEIQYGVADLYLDSTR